MSKNLFDTKIIRMIRFASSYNFKFENYWVGGVVRDSIRSNISPSDIPHSYPLTNFDVDITTPLNREGIEQYLITHNIPYFIVNKDYDTVCVNDGKICYEITPYRKDILCNGRHASHTPALSLEDDLSRRDFTVNAIAYDEANDEYVDPFNGINDIHNGIIRTVGNPEDRFAEDYLRIIRMIRFAANYNFKIEENTWKAAMKYADRVFTYISGERVFMEIDKAFKKKNSSRFIEMMDVLGIMKDYFPILKRIKVELFDKYTNPVYHPEGNTWNHIITCIDKADDIEDIETRVKMKWFALTHDLGKIEVCEKNSHGNYSFYNHSDHINLVDEFFDRIPVPNRLIDDCKFIMKNHMSIFRDNVSDKKIKRFINEYGEDKLNTLIQFKEIDSHLSIVDSTRKAIESIYNIMKKIKEESPIIKPIVNGKDIMTIFGIKEGREIGRIKNEMYDIQLEFNLNNKQDIIEKYNQKR